MAEMACDWYARAMEFGTGLRDWIASTAIQRFQIDTKGERLPVEHRTRVTVTLQSGEQVSGYAGGEAGDLSKHRSDAEIEEKFHSLTQDALGPEGAKAALTMLWRLDAITDVADGAV